MPHEPTAPFLECLRLGLTLKDSCEAADIPYTVARGWISRGRKAKPETKGPDRARYREIVAAQTAFRKAGQAAMLAGAKRGAPKALELLAEQVKRNDYETAPKLVVPSDPLERARMRLAEIQTRLPREKGIAYVDLLAAEDRMEVKVYDLETKAKTAAKETQGLRALKNADSIARLRTRLKKLDYGALLDLLAAAKAEAEEQGLST
ncbi:MAG: hypothetical protein WC911_10975 [Thermoleophilia bacterium]